MFDCKPLSCSAHSRLNFIVNEKKTILVGEFLQPLVVFRRRHNISTFTLHWLNQNCSRVFWRNVFLKNVFVYEIYTPVMAFRKCQLIRTPVTVSVRYVSYSRHQRKERASLSRLARSERKGAYRSTVEGAYEGYEQLPSTVPLREFDRSFNRFSAAVTKEDFLFRTPRRDMRKSVS